MSQTEKLFHTALETVPKASGNRGKYALITGVALGLGIFFVWWFKVQPFHGYVDAFVSGINYVVQTMIANAQTAFNALATNFASNPWPIIGAGISAVAAIYSIYSKLRSDRARAQTELSARDQVSTAQKVLLTQGQDLKMARDKLELAEKQLNIYKNDTFALEAQQIIASKDEKIRMLTETADHFEKLLKELELQKSFLVR